MAKLSSKKMIRSNKQDSMISVIDCLKDYINWSKETHCQDSKNKLNIELISVGKAKYNIILNCYAGTLINTCLSRIKFFGHKRTNYYKKLKSYDLEKIKKYDDDRIQKLCLEIIKDNLNYCFEKNKLELKVIKPKVQ